MAINIKWQTMPPQSHITENKPRLYPRLTENEIVDLQVLCEKVAKHGSYTKGTVKSIISDMIDIFAELLHEGKTIDIEEFGAFKLTIGSDKHITHDMPYNKRQVTIRGVNFQPHKAFMTAIGTPEFRTISRNTSPIVMSQDQIQEILCEYFKTHDSITRSEFEKLCKLKRATACIRLKKLVESGFLRKVGTNRETRYECS